LAKEIKSQRFLIKVFYKEVLKVMIKDCIKEKILYYWSYMFKKSLFCRASIEKLQQANRSRVAWVAKGKPQKLRDTRYPSTSKIHSSVHRLQLIWDTFFGYDRIVAISSDRQFPASPLANPTLRHLLLGRHLIVYNYALMNASGREHEIMFENSSMKRCML